MLNSKYGVLLVNLGTPTEPTATAVREFLKAFLSDTRVVDSPRIVWLPILYGIILNFRPKKVAANYRKIWTEAGSPLMVHSREQQQALQNHLQQNSTRQIKVELGMTYGKPSIRDAVKRLAEWGARQTIVLPLYPQYSYTTTASVTDQLERLQTQSEMNFKVIKDYHDNKDYIKALASSIKAKIQQDEKLIFSFHGLPKRYVSQGDPYQSQCEITARLVAEQLGLSSSQWELAYQSRVGREEWLKPYLDERMTQLAKEGTNNISVVCPGFSVDCLETLEEIAIQNKQVFIENGGQKLTYIKALNAQPMHVDMMAGLVSREIDLLET